MFNYLIVTFNTIILLIIIKLFANIFVKEKKPRSVADELMRIPQVNEMKQMYDLLNKMNMEGEGTDLDIIPEGFGEFGYDVTNPIPVNTIFGNTSYLARLRTLDGVKVRYDRVGSTGANNINGLIDIYDIYEVDEKICTLYICPYNKKNSQTAPRGFKLEK